MEKPLDQTGQHSRQELASLLGNPLPTWSFGPGWDKGHTVSPGGEGSRGWRKVALLVTQGPIQPGAWLSWAGWLGPAAATSSPGLGATAAGLQWMDGRLAELPGHIVGAPTGPRVDVVCLEPCHCAQCHVEHPNLCPGERAVHPRSPARPLGRPEETRPTCHLLFASLSREDVDRNSPHCRQEAELPVR